MQGSQKRQTETGTQYNVTYITSDDLVQHFLNILPFRQLYLEFSIRPTLEALPAFYSMFQTPAGGEKLRKPL